MAITQAITCDVCGKVKGEVNCWWMYDLPIEGFASGFGVWAWDSEVAHNYKHACGQVCVIKALNKWMQEATS